MNPFFLPKTLGAAALLTLTAASAHAESPEATRAKQQLDAYRGLPKFVSAGPDFDAKKCMADKSILGIPVSSANPFTKNINKAMGDVAKKVGYRNARIFAEHTLDVFELTPSRVRSHLAPEDAVDKLFTWLTVDPDTDAE